MWVELGQYALVLAFVVAIVQGTLPWWGVVRGDARVQAMSRTAAFTQLGLLVLSFVLLTLAFLQNDFSVDYIARQSNTYCLGGTRFPPFGVAMKVPCCYGR